MDQIQTDGAVHMHSVDLHACGCQHAKILVQVFIEEHQRCSIQALIVLSENESVLVCFLYLLQT
ncbi:hypothetical protein M514_04651 [Trichuris suis]|nr:hypothetical protein M514_04651 [Trichuris suis]